MVNHNTPPPTFFLDVWQTRDFKSGVLEVWQGLDLRDDFSDVWQLKELHF